MADAVQTAHAQSSLGLEPRTHVDFQFTYSQPGFSFGRRLVIRTVERLAGRRQLEALYRAWSASPLPGETIFAAAMRLMHIDINTDFAAWRKLPQTGPLLIVANHPFGVLDGLTIGYLATLIRRDIKIMTHSLLCQPKEARSYVLPVDFGGTAEAMQRTLQTRREAVQWLRDGHAVVIFPAGGVSTTVSPFSKHAVDSAWHPFTAKLAQVKDVRIVPVFFSGQNSRLFQIASHYSYALRLALLFRESVRRIGKTIEVVVGEAEIPKDTMSRTDLAAHLRQVTYALGGRTGPAAAEVFTFPAWMKFS